MERYLYSIASPANKWSRKRFHRYCTKFGARLFNGLSFQLHSKAISGGGVGKYSYYTGSTDATVKVWSSLALQQV